MLIRRHQQSIDESVNCAIKKGEWSKLSMALYSVATCHCCHCLKNCFEGTVISMFVKKWYNQSTQSDTMSYLMPQLNECSRMESVSKVHQLIENWLLQLIKQVAESNQLLAVDCLIDMDWCCLTASTANIQHICNLCSCFVFCVYIYSVYARLVDYTFDHLHLLMF